MSSLQRASTSRCLTQIISGKILIPLHFGAFRKTLRRSVRAMVENFAEGKKNGDIPVPPTAINPCKKLSRVTLTVLQVRFDSVAFLYFRAWTSKCRFVRWNSNGAKAPPPSFFERTLNLARKKGQRESSSNRITPFENQDARSRIPTSSQAVTLFPLSFFPFLQPPSTSAASNSY